MGGAPGEQDDALEQARLAGRVGPPDELRAGRQLDVERAVPAEVGQQQPLEQRRGGRRGCGRRDQEVVRTGITTWTYSSSPTGRNTPGESGPLSSIAKRSASTLVSTSAR